MVAHTATTPGSADTDPPRVSAPSAPCCSPPRHTLDDAEWADPQYRTPRGSSRKSRGSSPANSTCPTDPPRVTPPHVTVRGIPRTIPFNPSPEQLHDVLNDIVSPYASLVDVAANNNTTVHALSAWIALSETQAMLDQIEQAAYRRARVSAACLLTDAVNSLSFTLRAHVDAESNEPLGRSTEALHIRQRQRTDARKASWLLYRIARAYPAIPIDPNTLRFIHTLKRERDEQLSHRTPRVSERTASRVPLVPAERSEVEPVHHAHNSPADALHDLPLASSLHDDADSTANVSERTTSSPWPSVALSGETSRSRPPAPSTSASRAPPR